MKGWRCETDHLLLDVLHALSCVDAAPTAVSQSLELLLHLVAHQNTTRLPCPLKRGADAKTGGRDDHTPCTEHATAGHLPLESQLLVALIAEAVAGGSRSWVHCQKKHHVGCQQPSVRSLTRSSNAAVCWQRVPRLFAACNL